MKQKMKPLYNRVIVRRLDEVGVSTGGLIIPESAKEKQQRGEILALGPKVDSGLDLAVGQTVIFEKYAGHEFHKMQGIENCLIIREDEIIGVLE